ncbi:MAG: hypothetical protein KGL01_09450, partial [Betaproteobacteria bacterium]|nr:hypothetical protein [Betaproteobacteria bacterium]
MIPRFRDLPLNSKLNLALLLSSGVAVTLLFMLMLMNTVYNLRQEVVSQISILTEVTATNSAAALVFNDPKSAADTLAALRVKPEIMAAEIYNSSNQRFASYRSPKVSTDFKVEEVNRDHFWDPILSVSHFIVVDKELIGHVRVLADLSSQLAIVANQVLALGIAT